MANSNPTPAVHSSKPSPRLFARILVGPPQIVKESLDEDPPAASRKIVVEFPFGFAHSSAWHDVGKIITAEDIRAEVSRHIRTANEPAVGKQYDEPHFAGVEFLAHYVETSPDVEIVLDSADPRVCSGVFPRIEIGPPKDDGFRDAIIRTESGSYDLPSAVSVNSTSPDRITRDILKSHENDSGSLVQCFLADTIGAMPCVFADSSDPRVSADGPPVA